MKNIFLLLFLVVSLISFSQKTKSKKLSGLEQEVLAVNRQWAEALEHGDLATLDRILSDDLIVTSGSGEVENKTKEMEENKLDSVTKYYFFKTEDIRIRVYGNTAVLTGLCSWKIHEDGQDISDKRRYISVFVKEKNQWQIVAQQMTRFLPPKN